MGRFLKEAHLNVALLGLDKSAEERLINRLTRAGADEPGRIDVLRFKDMASCNAAVDRKEANAICIAIESFAPADTLAFISNIRVTHPTVPWCWVGGTKAVYELSSFAPAWRERFAHYYKFATDVKDEDIDESVGLVRDLLVADAVKSRALGQYLTTPGAVVRIRNSPPYGFWLMVGVTITAAVLGGAVSPIVQSALDKFKLESKEPDGKGSVRPSPVAPGEPQR